MGFFKRLFGWSTPAAKPASLPAPPPGFSWERFDEARVACLRPDGWHVHRATKDTFFSGCVSKESIQTDGAFQTGLTLLVSRGMKDGLRERHHDGFDPSYPLIVTFHGRGWPDMFADPNLTEVLYCDPAVQRASGWRLYRFQYRQLAPSDPGRPWPGPIIVQTVLIDFEQSSDVYELTFESPEASWEENWRKGKQLLTNLAFFVTPSSPVFFSFDPPLPEDDFLKAKALEVADGMGLRLAHENRAEGLFIWRLETPPDANSKPRFLGTFAWYMKRRGNEIWLDDPITLYLNTGGSQDVEEQINAELRELQEELKRRWLGLVGPVTLRGASPEAHSAELVTRAALEVARAQGMPPSKP